MRVQNETEKPAASPVPKLAFSMREAASALGVSYITVHRLLKRGLLKSSSALRTKIISLAEIERFLKETAQ
ncbi:MAG TPA: helix-turn-helix domain-containing protein [Verrucomicrobiae bacterium]